MPIEKQMIRDLHIQFNRLFKNPIGENAFEKEINYVSPIISQLINNIKKCSDRKVFRIVEFGCGDSFFILFIAHSLAAIYKKRILYVAIEIEWSANKLAVLNDLIPASIASSTQLIAADASQLEWFHHLKDKQLFNTAIFVHPVIENPFDAQKSFDYSEHSSKELAIITERFQKLHQQYLKFNHIFTQILPCVLLFGADILTKTVYDSEYRAAVKILSKISDVSEEKTTLSPEKYILAHLTTTYISPSIKRNPVNSLVEIMIKRGNTPVTSKTKTPSAPPAPALAILGPGK